ncbi:nitroreductase family protein [Dactylosporangium fulvum]|uniref:Nitroreductase family protein n=1 Tax=Dactylosporangium fulvum TaxID=53359 RepID=A0ABY5VQN5_9ACTN|nr:nitroreductase family protein [Dactylosporangium fulvum]UWP79605.1 nitroreductase family protein [Dactylosporangium fulvum]
MNDRLPERTIAACLNAAVAAPSIHNTQPWLFRPGGGAVEVLPDPARGLTVIDPDHRAMYISVGAAVCNLRLALAAEGWTSRLLAPVGAASASWVVPGPRREPGTGVQALAGAIARRRTNREPFEDAAVPADLLDTLRAAAHAPAVRLVVLDPVRRGAVLALAQAADSRQRTDPAYRCELAAWTGTDGTRRDGVTAATFGPRATTATLPQRDFGLQLPTVERAAARFEFHPQLVVLYSRGDTHADWLRSGHALQRVLLTATVLGIAVQPMTQALEVPAFRAFLTDPSGRWHAQMILRIGYGHPVHAGPRRPLRDVLMREPGMPVLPRTTAFSRAPAVVP